VIPDAPIPTGLIEQLALVVFDFDGVFTDNRVIVDETGREAVCCWRGDGIGLSALRAIGLEAVVLSTEVNPVVSRRCEKLKIACTQACEDKLAGGHALIEARGLSFEQLCFVGNDINDLPLLQVVGLPIVVADAHPAVLDVARYQTRTPGGLGAVREICDLLVAARTR
jgi:YrbI family 3-deoxy-D-manno-octulosonate 8-phosphate phosphatase